MTDLEEWKALWAEQDRKLDQSLRLNRRLLEESALGRARTALGSLRRFVVVELVSNVVAVVALVAFAAANPQPRFAAPAVLLALGALALVRGDVLQLRASRIDPSEPIAAAQRRLEGLRRLRVTHVRWTLLLSPLAWPPLAIVALKVLLGADAWVSPGVAWLAANLAFGIAVPVIAWIVSVRYGSRLRGSPWAARMANAISGRSLVEALHALEAIRELETD